MPMKQIESRRNPASGCLIGKPFIPHTDGAANRKEVLMGIALEQIDNSTMLRLDGAIDIACAAELKTLLRDAIASGTDVCVALDHATELDITAVQLLWAGEREARNAGVAFAFAGHMPEPIFSGLLLTGFEQFASTMDASKSCEVVACQP
jgi:anti-anti-sigma regulatory factor